MTSRFSTLYLKQESWSKKTFRMLQKIEEHLLIRIRLFKFYFVVQKNKINKKTFISISTSP